MTAREPDPLPRFGFSSRLRVKRAGEFEAVYARGVGRRLGPLSIHARPNDLGHARLGLSVSARVGNAVQRNRIKRRLREAFRHRRHELPGAYDVVVTVRAHDPLSVEAYGDLLVQAVRGIHRTWTKRLEREEGEASAGG